MPPIWKGTTALIEAADSPNWQFGEQVTMVRRLTGPHATCLSSAPFRGAIGTGAAAGLRVLRSEVKRSKGGIGELTIEYGTAGLPAQGAQLPEDEAEISFSQIERNVREHPRYAGFDDALRSAITYLLEYKEGTNRQAAQALVDANPRAAELLRKLERQETHYVLYPPQYQLTQYYWLPPANLSAGGFRESPPSAPIPLPANTAWLRKGDQLIFNGTHWKLTKVWIGAPEWDADLYP